MTQLAKAADGRLRALGPDGLWRDATQQEQMAAETSEFDALMAQGPRVGLGLKDLATAAATSTLGDVASMVGLSDVDRSQSPSNQALSQFAERERLFQPLDAQFPGATAAGGLALDPLNALPVVGKVLSQVAARTGRQTARAATSEAGATAAEQAAPIMDEIGGAIVQRSGQGSVDSAGAASFMDFIPRSVREPVERAMNEIFVPGELSADQRAVLPLADEMGWQFLPGQRSGNTFGSELALSDPIVRDAFSYELGENRKLLNNRAAAALGRESGEEFGESFLDDTGAILGEQFDEIAAELPDIPFGENSQLRTDLQAIYDSAPADLDLEGTEGVFKDLLRIIGKKEMENMDGVSLQRFHSRWRDRAQRAGRSQDPAGNQVGDVYFQMVDALNAAVERTGGKAGAETLTEYKRIREQYRVLKVMERPGVLNRQTGDFSPLVASTQFRREFGSQFRRAEGRTVQPETSELFDTVQVARRFKDTLGDSGTASRRSLAELANPKKLAGRLAIRELIKRRIPASNAAD